MINLLNLEIKNFMIILTLHSKSKKRPECHHLRGKKYRSRGVLSSNKYFLTTQ